MGRPGANTGKSPGTRPPSPRVVIASAVSSYRPTHPHPDRENHQERGQRDERGVVLCRGREPHRRAPRRDQSPGRARFRKPDDEKKGDEDHERHGHIGDAEV